MAKGLKVCQVKIPVYQQYLKYSKQYSDDLCYPLRLYNTGPSGTNNHVCMYKVYMGKVYCYMQHF